MKIKKIIARHIFDSRGNPTIEVDVITNKNIIGRASVPSGASKGKYEAIEKRDNNKKKFNGNGVIKSIKCINNKISPELLGLNIYNQRLIDNIMIELDGTNNKKKLGSNSILGISLAVSRAAANSLNIPLYKYIGGINLNELPVPMINIINCGVHSRSTIAFQEFMIIPIGANTFFESLEMSFNVFNYLKNKLYKTKKFISIGDEGGISTYFKNVNEILDVILLSIEKNNYYPGDDISIGIDCASSEFYINKKYDYRKFEGDNGKILSSEEQISYIKNLINKYPIISIEDPMDQDDWKGWEEITNQIGNNIQIVGDDLFVTNYNRLKNGIDKNSANSILIKPNQIGTLSETLDVINLAKNNGYSTIMSHRSGETEDNIISDLSVGFNTKQIKTGSLTRSDRNSKYNQLLRIEEEIGKYALYPQKKSFKCFNKN